MRGTSQSSSPALGAAAVLAAARDEVSKVFHGDGDSDPDDWRNICSSRAKQLESVPEIGGVIEVAILRTVCLWTHEVPPDVTVEKARELDTHLPGAGTLLLMAALDGAVALDLDDHDIAGYGIETREQVEAVSFPERWGKCASTEPAWSSYTLTALAVLALPPCDTALLVLEDPSHDPHFWLTGDVLEVLDTNPDPAWRTARS